MNLRQQVFANSRLLIEFYREMSKLVARKYSLSRVEAIIIDHLYEFQANDTANKIANHRMATKSMISEAVENLIENGLLIRNFDKKDRRVVHLILTKKAKPITEFIESINSQLDAKMLENVDEQELNVYSLVNSKIVKNMTEFSKDLLVSEGNNDA